MWGFPDVGRTGGRRAVPAGDGGYVTVRDRSRPLLMYSVVDADPRVIAVDVATKETNTFGEISTIGDANAPG